MLRREFVINTKYFVIVAQ